MGRRTLYAVGVAGLLIAAGALAWRTWSHTSMGTFDPVSAVIGIASLAVSVASFGLAARAQRQADTDIANAAAQLAVAVEQEETEARRQLLGGNNRTINVQFTFKPAPAHEASGANSEGTLERVVAYYRKLQPHRMVITGAAGSGKTVLAVELILGLLKDRPAGAPVPVRMSAASLDTSRPSSSAVVEWIVEHLRQAYKMSDAAARQLVAARMVLPVLDGVDEMDAIEAPAYASRAGQAIRACNAYLDGQQKAAIVLTCRISQYEALEQAREWVHDAARIQLLPVGIPAARSFLTARVTDQSRWQPVLDSIKQPGNLALAQAISTPWRLTLAATVYDQRDKANGDYLRDPTDLLRPTMDTEEKIRDHLLSLYILATIAAHGARYPAPYVHRWLGVLASYLNANTVNSSQESRVIAGLQLSGTDLVLHELWPLAGFRLPRIVTAFMMTTVSFSLFIVAFTSTALTSGFGPRQITFFSVWLIFLVVGIRISWIAWPTPSLVNLWKIIQQIRISLRHRRVPPELLLGLLLGLALGLVGRFLVGIPFVGSLVAGLILALVIAFVGETDEYTVTEPREIVRTDFIAGLVVTLAGGLAGGFLWRTMIGIGVGLASGLAAGLLIGLTAARYLTLLLCTRRWTVHWLPWRLETFLNWCYQAGLLRIAGVGYQFRHKELQEYLATIRPLARLRQFQRHPGE